MDIYQEELRILEKQLSQGLITPEKFRSEKELRQRQLENRQMGISARNLSGGSQADESVFSPLRDRRYTLKPNNSFILERPLSASGRVWLALDYEKEQDRLKRLVAMEGRLRAARLEQEVKVVLKFLTGAVDRQEKERFQDELEILDILAGRHPHKHITYVLDSRLDWLGAMPPGLVLHYFEGEKLADRLASATAQERQTLAAAVLRDMTKVLVHLREHRVVHRDLSPNNILINADNQCYLIDFDRSVVLDDQGRPHRPEVTDGTRGYQAPELRTDPGPQSDLFSLACVLFNTLTGQLPKFLDDLGLNERSPVFPHLQLPEEVMAVLEKASARRQDQRYDRVEAFSEAFRNACTAFERRKHFKEPLRQVAQALDARLAELAQLSDVAVYQGKSLADATSHLDALAQNAETAGLRAGLESLIAEQRDVMPTFESLQQAWQANQRTLDELLRQEPPPSDALAQAETIDKATRQALDSLQQRIQSLQHRTNEETARVWQKVGQYKKAAHEQQRQHLNDLRQRWQKLAPNAQENPRLLDDQAWATLQQEQDALLKRLTEAGALYEKLNQQPPVGGKPRRAFKKVGRELDYLNKTLQQYIEDCQQQYAQRERLRVALDEHAEQHRIVGDRLDAQQERLGKEAPEAIAQRLAELAQQLEQWATDEMEQNKARNAQENWLKLQQVKQDALRTQMQTLENLLAQAQQPYQPFNKKPLVLAVAAGFATAGVWYQQTQPSVSLIRGNLVKAQASKVSVHGHNLPSNLVMTVAGKACEADGGSASERDFRCQSAEAGRVNYQAKVPGQSVIDSGTLWVSQPNWPLTVKTQPPISGVEIHVDDNPYQPGMKLEEGPHTIQVTGPTITQQTWTVALDAEHLSFTLDLKPQTWPVTLNTTPEDASIRLISKQSNWPVDVESWQSGQAQNLPTGAYEFGIEAEGYQRVQRGVRVNGGVQTLKVDLERAAPTLYPLTIETTPRDAQVRILNIAPKYQPGMQLAPGTYVVDVSKAGYETVNRTVTLGQEAKVERIVLSAKASPLLKQLGLAFVDIPAGRFMMGCSPNDTACDGDEYTNQAKNKRQHEVTVPAFKLMKYEVTQAQWERVMGSNPSHFDACGGDCPVENVSWEMVQAFINKLNAQTGQHFRLPSEAEWEYAARAKTNSPFAFGDRITTDQANFDGDYTYNGSAKGVYREKTVKVGSFQPNQWGVYDMHGNVWEWTQDCWNASYQGAPVNGKAWEQGGCAKRVVRGGSWNTIPGGLRSSYRFRGGTANRDSSNGFRLAQD